MIEIKLNDGQQEALVAMIEFAKGGAYRIGDGADNMFVLKGYAGTGKSTSIQFLVRHFIKNNIDVACTAPTNKATKVLREMAKEHELRVDTMTIYRMLGLSVKQNEDKEEIEKVINGFIGRYRVVIVDEASMVNQALYEIIAKESVNYGVNIIFVGDPAQLPPVGETDSRVFGLENQYCLTEIVRQAEDNPIISLSKELRSCISDAEAGVVTWPQIARHEGSNGKSDGIYRMPGESFETWMPSAFLSDEYKSNVDSFRILAWTNRRVDYFNDKIQRMIYGEMDTPFAVGEMAVFRKPLVSEEKNVLIATDEEVKIVSMNREVCSIYGNYLWKIIVKTDMDVEWPVWFADNLDMVEVGSVLSQLAKDAKKETDKAKKKLIWQDFWTLKNLISDIAKCYALTVHRSQGSTFRNVFVDVDDIMRNREWRDALRLLYVGVTRAKDSIVVNA